MIKGIRWEEHWIDDFVDFFLDKVVLALLGGILVFLVTNPPRWETTTLWGAGLITTAVAFCISYVLERRNEAKAKMPEDGKPKFIRQSSYGANSPNIVGNNNTVVTGPVAREIPDHAAENMVVVLSAYEVKAFKVLAAVGNPEAYDLALRIMQIIEAAQWIPIQRTIVEVMTGIAGGPLPPGVIIDSPQADLPAATTLANLLTRNGCSAIAQRGQFEWIEINVQAKPTSSLAI